MKQFLQIVYYTVSLTVTGIFILPGSGSASEPGLITGLTETHLLACLGIICFFLLVLSASTILLLSQYKKLNRQLAVREKRENGISPPTAGNDAEIQPTEKYNDLINTLQDGCVEFSFSGVVLNINNAVANIFNCKRSDLIGQHYAELLSVTDNTEIENVYKTIYRTGESAQIKNVEVTGMDNVKRIVEVSASLMNGENGTPEGFRGIFRDVTELIQAEMNQNLLKEQLQRSQQIEAIGALAGGIAHDFNNILMAIQGNASILLFNMKKDNVLYDKLTNIEACVNSGAELTQQLLGFAREKKSDPGILNFNTLVKETAETLRRTRKDVQLHEKLDPEIWDIEADPGQIRQVILSLFINSWQMGPEARELYVGTANRVLDKQSAVSPGLTEGHYAVITIANHNDESPDSPVDDSTGDIKTGINAGLGIISSSEIIKSYNGLIEFKKTGADKTSYTLYFPSLKNPATKKIEFVVTHEKGSGTVLFVDDEEMIIDVGKPMLEELGYEVLVARGGEEAIKVYEVHKGDIDLVILDMIMPKVDGGEVYNVLKKINPDVKTILSSGYSMDEQADTLIEKGCTGFIQKPFNLKGLSEKIGSLLN